MRRQGEPVRLLFLILAHDEPAHLARLAATLTAAAGDARVVVHFDAGARPELFADLETRVAALPRIRLVRDRLRCEWGRYSLVEAPLRALAEAQAAGEGYDYAVLLSGTCLPCRPIAQLERFLAANSGREFIETGDSGWIRDGLREERHGLYFFLRPMRRRWADRLSVRVQRWLGVKRRFPEPLVPRFGSQWWALTWQTCEAMLDFTAARPDVVRFFRRTWIPDELVIPTLVHHLVPAERIAGFSLTHYQFTRRGKPIVYYDDHANYVLGLQRFFVRKVAPEATVLRERCLARAAEPDDGEPLDRIGEASDDYVIKTRAQTHYPVPGQTFYRSQFDDQNEGVLATLTTPYVIVIAPAEVAAVILRHLRGGSLHPLGRVFAADRVDFGPDVASLDGLHPDDVALRDLHPALYLTRIRTRIAGVPVIACSPFDARAPLDAVLDDPAALKVACLPPTRTADAFLRKLIEVDGDGARLVGFPPFDHPRWLDAAIATRLPPATRDRSSRLAALMRDASRTTVRVPLLPSTVDRGGVDVAVLRQSRETCDFRAEAWFDELVHGMERACSALGPAEEAVPSRRVEAAE